MAKVGIDTLKTRKTMTVGDNSYDYFSLKEAEDHVGSIENLPKSLKVLFENILRCENGDGITTKDVQAIADWQKKKSSDHEIAYSPARVLLQDFTGVPAVVDLAAMREGIKKLGGDADDINPLTPVDLVIDHSVMVDAFGTDAAFQYNVEKEFERNFERYKFLKWGQKAFKNFRVVPPGTGICHQVNLEYLGKGVWTSEADDGSGKTIAYPDTLVGTDSHTTMINGLAVLGWGVGGIEAEAGMLGQPISMLIPDVVGFKITGELPEGATATDLVLTVTQMLRQKGVVGKFVEFYGDGLANMTIADRATISNMAPEYGATCGFFPTDDATLRYLEFTGRSKETIELVEAYTKEQGLWRKEGDEPVFTDTLHLDLSDVVPSIAGPKNPHEKVALSEAATAYSKILKEDLDRRSVSGDIEVAVDDEGYDLTHGDIVIAAITSCTNTSNPSVMIASGLVARKARERGLTVKPWVKTSLAPGSKVVTDYLEKSGLQDDLDDLGFNLVGYGCTTCIGNSGPLPEDIGKAVDHGKLNVCSVLSGNRNFEGRISQQVRSNYLASPPLVVAYALAGSMKIDLIKDPLGQDKDGHDVFLKDIWPTSAEIQELIKTSLTPEMFRERYSNVFEGTEEWREIETTDSQMYDWQDQSTYVRNPPFFDDLKPENDNRVSRDLHDARALMVLGDYTTTDHISPAGAIKPDSPAGEYLQKSGIEPFMFNSYGSRRGNHEVMMRGTFANIRIRNQMLDGVEGGYTKYIPTGETMTVYDAAMKYIADKTPLVVIGGKGYGMGSSRDWAAKGTRLLGVSVVIADSFERIHRSNLIGMGVLPAEFTNGENRETLGITGEESYTITGIDELKPRKELSLTITYPDGSTKETTLLTRIDTGDELSYYHDGGILHYVLKDIVKRKTV